MLRDSFFTRQNGDRDNIPNVAIVITDGKSNIRDSETLGVANKTKEAGIRIIAVGVTDAIDVRELRGIASVPSQVITVADFDRLLGQLNQVINQICVTV